MTGWIENDGRQIWYADEGKGQPFVFVHDWAGQADSFEAACERLKTNFRCIRYDLSGHHRSVCRTGRLPEIRDLARDLEELMARLNVKKPILVGWSLGASVILEYVRRCGESGLRGLVLTEMSPCLLRREDWACGWQNGSYTEKDLEADLALMQANFSDFLFRHFRLMRPDASESELAKRVHEVCENCDPAVLRSLYESVCRADYRPLLAKIRRPAAVFGAERSVFPEPLWEYYTREIRSSFMRVRFEEADHDLVRLQPDRFAKALEAFAVFMGSFQPEE